MYALKTSFIFLKLNFRTSTKKKAELKRFSFRTLYLIGSFKLSNTTKNTRNVTLNVKAKICSYATKQKTNFTCQVEVAKVKLPMLGEKMTIYYKSFLKLMYILKELFTHRNKICDS